MRSASSLPSSSSDTWRHPSHSGFFFDNFASDSAWIRETGVLQLPPSIGVEKLVLHGEFRPHPDARGLERGAPTLACFLDGQPVGGFTDLKPGTFELSIPLSAASAHRGPRLEL